MKIHFENVTCGYANFDVLHSVNMNFESGKIYSILGSNGVGKTTLFKTLLRFIQPKSGKIIVDGKDIQKFSTQDYSSLFSYVPQAKERQLQLSVKDVILMGRAPYIKKIGGIPRESDYKVVSEKMKMLGISDFAQNSFNHLSGGQQQLVLIARALVQESSFVVMDEPTSALDFENQKKILDIVKTLSDKGVGIIMSCHTPQHAFYCNSEVIAIAKDKSILCGSANEILTEENLRKIYGVSIGVVEVNDKKTICI